MTTTTTANTASPAPHYVAVVLFHGMGQQRHHEPLAELVESIDAFVFAQHRADPAAFRSPRINRKTRRERIRPEAGAPDTGSPEAIYVQTDYSGGGAAMRVRFYEGYWAPATVAGTTSWSVFHWLIAQLGRPLKVLAAPWRAFGRLRRADLLRKAFAKAVADPAQLPPGYAPLVRLYARFTRRRPPDPGSFASFVEFISEEIADKDHRKKAVKMARAWRRRHVRRQLTAALALLLTGLTIAAGAVLLLLGVIAMLQWTFGWLDSFADGSFPKQLAEHVKPDFKTAWSFLALLLGAIGVSGFLRDAVGDVQQFVTYEEAQPLHERREKILALAECTLRQVLTDDACRRVVIVAHSLGTAVALDAILRLRAANEAANPTASADAHRKRPLDLTKLQHFVTCGSPIDRINYFFTTLRSRYRSFETMVDDLRGDIGDVPFSRPGRQPYIHWVNFWDRGDPISGPLYTVASADELRLQRVDNVQVTSYLWPDPGASHTAYFEHRTVAGFVFRAAFSDAASFANPPRVPPPAGQQGDRPDYQWQGPGRGSRLQGALLWLVPVAAVMLIWTTIGLLVPGLFAPTVVELGAVVGVIVAGALVQRLRKLHRARVDPKA